MKAAISEKKVQFTGYCSPKSFPLLRLSVVNWALHHRTAPSQRELCQTYATAPQNTKIQLVHRSQASEHVHRRSNWSIEQLFSVSQQLRDATNSSQFRGCSDSKPPTETGRKRERPQKVYLDDIALQLIDHFHQADFPIIISKFICFIGFIQDGILHLFQSKGQVVDSVLSDGIQNVDVELFPKTKHFSVGGLGVGVDVSVGLYVRGTKETNLRGGKSKQSWPT